MVKLTISKKLLSQNDQVVFEKEDLLYPNNTAAVNGAVFLLCKVNYFTM